MLEAIQKLMQRVISPRGPLLPYLRPPLQPPKQAPIPSSQFFPRGGEMQTQCFVCGLS